MSLESQVKGIIEGFRSAVFDAGYLLGKSGEYAEPLPVGSLLRESWEQGMEKGLAEFEVVGSVTKGPPLRKGEVKPHAVRGKHSVRTG